MKISEWNNKLEQFHYFVNIKKTGVAAEFAEKLGVCERTIGYILEFLRENGVDIGFDKYRRSYYYKNRFTIQFFKIKIENTDEIMGGKNLFDFFSSLQNSCRLPNNLCDRLMNEEEQNDAGGFASF